MWTSVSPWSRVGPPRVRGKDLAGDENRGGGSLAAPPPPASAAHNEVGRCRLTVSKTLLTAPMVSALESVI